MPADLRRRTREWIAGDPDPGTRRQLEELLEHGDEEALAAHVDGRLTFGTAGLRAPVGPGPRRMNRAVVIRTTRGLADHLLAERGTDGDLTVAVGFDARPDSERFARDVVGVLAAAGLSVVWFPDPAPTPLVAFAAKRLDTAAAVVVTASHNPPEYNGYKVYGPGGIQIVPPADASIARAIGTVGPADAVPRVAEPTGHPAVTALGEPTVRDYLAAAAAARPELVADRSIRIVHTPLHGVGGELTTRMLTRAGFHDVRQVPEQAEPDGTFPTVAFPNPEEPGAMDLAFEHATVVDADLVLANDPDADRLAVAVPDDGGGFRQLTGNQVGLLLADHLLRHSGVDRPLVVSSVVSSPALGAVAAAHGARWETTLTGFKWICTAAAALEGDGLQLVLGYEEALGYTVGSVVRDKDGIAAAAVMADLVAGLRAAGRTVEDALVALARRDGLWVSHRHSEMRPGPEGAAAIEAAMDTARRADIDSLAGRPVSNVTDFATGAADRPRWLPATNLVAYELEGGRALVRPSGTEPKLKIYVDLRAGAAVGAPGAVEDSLRGAAGEVAEALVDRIGM